MVKTPYTEPSGSFMGALYGCFHELVFFSKVGILIIERSTISGSILGPLNFGNSHMIPV